LPEFRHGARVAAIAGAALAMGITGATAGAAQQQQQAKDSAFQTDGYGAAAIITQGRSSFSAQDENSANHLPAARENIELVSKFEPLSQGPIVPGQIADVAVFKNTAYLMSWARGNTDPGVTPASTCTKGGFYSVDISNPAAPKELAFRKAEFGTYHGEGAHVISMNTPAFKGDVLGVNNEPCVAQGTGGFDLYDVTDPANPKPLVIAAGDKSVPPTQANPNPAPRAKPNSSHSTFLWQDGPKAYAVIVDNIETTDVDIFDITDPTNPVQIGDFDLETKFPSIVGSSANGNAVFLHDMVVKEIGGKQIMLASYWDGGYVQLDVSDPKNPELVGDTDFGTKDPLTGKTPPEGNGHYAEFSHDDRYMLAADEDFSPFRFKEFRMTTGPNAGVYPAGEFGFTKPIATLEDNNLNGPTVYGGYGCDASPAIPTFASTGITLQPDEESLVVLQRGPVNDPSNPYAACTFQEKAENAEAAGYDGVVIANHHSGSNAGAAPDAILCGSGTGADVYGVCIGHRQFHLLFNDAPDYDADYTPNSEPAIGTKGEKVQGSVEFDGWGFAHVFDRATGKELGAYAIEESLDERFSSGFGDLSIHEWATDPTENIAYSAYYSGGIRVARFGDFGIQETAKFIDKGGSNFWGVEQFTTAGGERLIAGSDRDFGLYILRYVGPEAAKPPVCEEESASTTPGAPTQIALTCTDANGNPLSVRITDPPDNGTVSNVTTTARSSAAVTRLTYTPNPGFVGTDSFAYVANDGAADSAERRVTVTVSQAPTATPTPTPGPYYGIKRKPSLTAFAKPKRDPKKPFIFRVQGRLILPNGVSKADGCKGTVRIIGTKGRSKKVLVKRRTGIKSTCKYKARAKLRKNKAGKRGTVRFKVQFLGNERLFKASKTTKAKYGKKRR
jgi:hypothetical protein